MKHSPIIANTPAGLLDEDGTATLICDLAELLVIGIKEHGHFGNVMHHVSGGDWAAVEAALRYVFLMPNDHRTMPSLAWNLVTMLHGSSAKNLRPFRPWLLDQVEQKTSSLYRETLERRLDQLADRIRAVEPALTRSAVRIISGKR